MGNVFDIQRYSIHDGYGIRTVVFLKGCPLHCAWCANPESQSRKPELFYSEASCISCKTCVQVCPNQEIILAEDGKLEFHRERLMTGQLEWIDACPTGALTIKGIELSPEETAAEVRKDKAFYGTEGGVTFSGGEPLLQAEFVRDTEQICKAEGITTAVETTGAIEWSQFELVLPYTDLFLYDIKSADSTLHKKWTGISNVQILENLKRLSQTGADIMVRTPLIPGVNNTVESVKEIAELIEHCGIRKYDILPFHQYGSAKYKAIGKEYALASLEMQKDAEIERIREQIRVWGFSQI